MHVPVGICKPAALLRIVAFSLPMLACSGAALGADPACSAPPRAAPELAQLWPTSDDIERALILLTAVQDRLAIGDDIIRQSLRSENVALMRIAARYPWLKPEDIDYVLRQPDSPMIEAMLRSGCVDLSFAQLDALIGRQLAQDTGQHAPDRVLRALVRPDGHEFTPAQAWRLSASSDPVVGLFVARRYHIGDLPALTASIIKAGGSNVIPALRMLDELPSDIVDMVLDSPSVEVRRFLAKQGKMHPTVAQQERILNDPDHEVRIALLSRRDIALDAAQVQRGAQTDDDKLGFWYWERPEFQPTPAQVEEGLTSQVTLKRRHFALRRGDPLSAMQIERGLTDEDHVVRWAFLGNPAIRLNDAQLDRCTVANDFSEREACLKRADYAMTQARFNTLLLDANPNALRIFSRPSDESKRLDFGPLIDAALAGNSPPLIKALARNIADLPMTAEQRTRANQLTR